MLVLSVDPGTTTGVAVVSSKAGIVLTSAIPINQIYANLAQAQGFFPPITHLVMEAAPSRSGDERRAWSLTRDYLGTLFGDLKIAEVSPGHWKPLKSVLKNNDDKLSTQHEKDAVYIARYLIRKELSR